MGVAEQREWRRMGMFEARPAVSALSPRAGRPSPLSRAGRGIFTASGSAVVCIAPMCGRWDATDSNDAN